MKTYKRVCLLALAFLLAITPPVLMLGTSVVLSTHTKTLFGYRFLNVLTDSMRPTFNKGDMIIVRLCAPENVHVGDIITFAMDEEKAVTLSHRVVDILTELDGEQGLWFLTRGDAYSNDFNSTPIAATYPIQAQLCT